MGIPAGFRRQCFMLSTVPKYRTVQKTPRCTVTIGYRASHPAATAAPSEPQCSLRTDAKAQKNCGTQSCRFFGRLDRTFDLSNCSLSQGGVFYGRGVKFPPWFRTRLSNDMAPRTFSCQTLPRRRQKPLQFGAASFLVCCGGM